MNVVEPTSVRRPVVLLTGASSGLGSAIAQELRGRGYRLLLTARAESVARFAQAGWTESESDGIHLRTLDVRDGDQRSAIVSEAEERWGGVDVLINNAAVAYRTVVEHWDESAWWETMETDVHGPFELIRLILPGMRRKRAGRILNVSSVGGMMAMPTLSLYSAAKFALEGASEALWYEVRPWNIRVTLVEPGFIRSDSFRNTRFTALSFRGMLTADDPYHEQYLHLAGFIERMMDRAWATPATVAARVVGALRQSHPPLRLYATFDAHGFAWLRRVLPRRLYHLLLYRALPHVRAGHGEAPFG